MYITADYFRNVFGTDAPADFVRLEAVTQMMFQGIGVPADLNDVEPSARALIMMAAAEQINFFVRNGGADALNETSVEVTSATLGRFSYSTTSEKGSKLSGFDLSPLARVYLERAGYGFGQWKAVPVLW